MEVTVAAFLFAKRNMEIDHEVAAAILVPEAPRVDEILEVIAQTQHKTVARILLQVGKAKIIHRSERKTVDARFDHRRKS